MQKSIAIGICALLAIMLVASVALPTYEVEAKKGKAKNVKCNNVKVLVMVHNVVNNTAYTASVTLGAKTAVKTVVAELDENETSIVIPLHFKKQNPCPVVGDAFAGHVNDTTIAGNISSLKKPNFVHIMLE